MQLRHQRCGSLRRRPNDVVAQITTISLWPLEVTQQVTQIAARYRLTTETPNQRAGYDLNREVGVAATGLFGLEETTPCMLAANITQ